jgi:hypothetical protein
MSKLLTTSLSTLVLALGITGAAAQEAGSGMMQGCPQGQPPAQSGQPGWGMHGAMPWAHGHMGQGRMGQSRGPNMMALGMMGGGMMGPEMMVVMMDTNGDGVLSLDEFQAIHARMFKYLDANHDGQLTADELNAFHSDSDDDQGGK